MLFDVALSYVKVGYLIKNFVLFLLLVGPCFMLLQLSFCDRILYDPDLMRSPTREVFLLRTISGKHGLTLSYTHIWYVGVLT